MKVTTEQESRLQAPLPKWALSSHPTKKGKGGKPMTVINPMAVIDRLNDVYGVGGWNFRVEHINHEEFTQKTRSGDRQVFRSAVKVTLSCQETVIEQFGGSTNDDLGDALKGGATDALTKCASYLGIGANIYKGMGNGDLDEAPDELDDLTL